MTALRASDLRTHTREGTGPRALGARDPLALAARMTTPPDALARRDTPPGTGPAAVWVLADDKLGHSTQSVGLAEALGWPYEVKALRFNALNRISNRLLGTSLVSLDRRRSARLEPPWPALVIATGRRTVPVARWIGAQTQGRTRLVQIGRKGADRADSFDLTVTCAHFGLPAHPRRVETLAPLTAISDERMRAAAERWRDLFLGLPRPHVALLVGGSSAMHQLNAETAARLARDTVGFARGAGGSVYVVTSPRTEAAAVAALRAGVGEAGRLYQWKAGDPDNPYLGCLAVADVLVATGDSESMLAETAATGKPLYIYDLPERRGNLQQRLRAWVGAHARSQRRDPEGDQHAQRRIASLCASMLEHGIVRAPRDLSAMHQALIDAGYAHAFGAALETAPHAPLRELDLVAERIRAMLDERGTGGS